MAVVELGVISWVRHRYMETPALSAALQVGLGGVLVFATGILIEKIGDHIPLLRQRRHTRFRAPKADLASAPTWAWGPSGALRGYICGLMTAVGGIGNTLPFLIGDL